MSDTYARILSDLDEKDEAYARRALIWIACAKRSLSINEIAEAAIVNPDECPPVVPENRLMDPVNDIGEILGCLVTVDSYEFDSNDSSLSYTYVKLAHFSVKDYLMSEERTSNILEAQDVPEIAGEEAVIRSCLAYMMHCFQDVRLSASQTKIKDVFPALDSLADLGYLDENYFVRETEVAKAFLSDYPLIGYATKCVRVQLDALPRDRRRLMTGGVLLDFFGEFEQLIGEPQGTLLKLACIFGLDAVVQHLLTQCTISKDTFDLSDIGFLVPTMRLGHEEVLCMLTDHLPNFLASEEQKEIALQWAAASNRSTFLEYWLKRGVKPIAWSSNSGCPALHEAAWYGNKQILELLLQYGAPVNAPDLMHSSPLHQTIRHAPFDRPEERVEMVQVLLDAGADPNLKNDEGLTPLGMAMRLRMDKIVSILKNHGGTMPNNERLLLAALQIMDTNMVEQILEQSLDMATLAKTELGVQIFIAAADTGFEHLVTTLYECGVPIDCEDQNGYTALMRAAAGYHDIVRLLLDKGADVNRSNKSGGTALLRAVQFGHEDIVKMLLDSKADVHAMNSWGHTAIHKAATYGKVAILRQLLDLGVNIEATDKMGRTPLFSTLYFGANYATVQTLLDAHAKIDAVDDDHCTTLHIAIIHGQEKIVRLLLERDARIDMPDKDGNNALDLAMKLHSPPETDMRPIIKLLQQAKATRDAEAAAAASTVAGSPS